MPRISKIRMTNISYDRGKKFIPDILIDVKGANSLLILSNGGGKTLLIQLLLQSILPNEPLCGRRISDLFIGSTYTGHVVVEWILDTKNPNQNFLCTGFCFTKGIDAEQRVNYYNYVLEYGETSPLQISDIPLTIQAEGSRRAIGYGELRTWLRKNGFSIYDQINAYQSRLRIYQIIPEEWKNIRDTNSSEGGVDKFFQRSRTNIQLLDNLLIPIIEEMIYTNEERRKTLLATFNQYRHNISEIPAIQKNIKDFGVLQEEAGLFLEHLRELHELQMLRGHRTLELKNAFHLALKRRSSVEKQIQEFESEIEILTARCHDYLWQIESHSVFLNEQASRQAQEIYLNCVKVLKDEEHVLASKKLQKNRSKALFYYNKALETKRDIERYNKNLELLGKDFPDITKELAGGKRNLAIAWKKRHEELRLIEIEVRRELGELDVFRKELERKKSQLAIFQQDVRYELTKLNLWMEELDRRRLEIRDIFQADEYDPLKVKSGITHKMIDLGKSISKIEVQIIQLNKNKDFLHQSIMQADKTKQQLVYQLDLVSKQLGSYKKDEKSLKQKCLGNIPDHLDIIYNQDVIIHTLSQQLEQIRSSSLKLQTRIFNLQEKYNLIRNRDYYVPNYQLQQMQEYLSKKGVIAVLGSRWLAEQPMTTEQKEACISRQPLLPYCLLVEETQLTALNQIMASDGLNTYDFPMIFISRGGYLLENEELEVNLVELQKDRTYLLRPNPSGMYSSKERFISLKGKIDNQILVLEREVEVLKRKEENVLECLHGLRAFFSRYSLDIIKGWYEEKDILDKNVVESEKQIMRAKDRILDIDSEQKLMEKDLKDQKKQYEVLKENQLRMDRFLEYFVMEDETRAKIEALQRRLNNNQVELEGIDKRQLELIQASADLKGKLRDIKREIEQHEREFKDFGLTLSLEEAKLEGDYFYWKNQIKAIEDSLFQITSEKRNLEALLERAKQNYSLLSQELEKSMVGYDWLDSNLREVNNEEVNAHEREYEQQQARVEALKQELFQANVECKAALEVVRIMSNKLKVKYGREPFLDFEKGKDSIRLQEINRKFKEAENKREALAERLDVLRQELRDWDQLIDGVLKREFEFSDLLECFEGSVSEEDIAGISPQHLIKMQIEKDKLQGQCELKKLRVKDNFERYLEKINATGNPNIRTFANDLKKIWINGKIYDHEFMEKQFALIKEAFCVYEKQYVVVLEEHKKDKDHLINLCYRRAKAVYDSIMEMPKTSKVKIYEHEIQILRIQWEMYPEDQFKVKMSTYLDKAIEDAQKWQAQGLTEDIFEKRLEAFFQTRNLINLLAPLTKCNIKIYKPRTEEFLRHNKPQHYSWNEVTKWSGGEEYGVYISLYMVMLGFIRAHKNGTGDSWKVLVADNPFGKASSNHILETVFQVAEKNKFQLICLTAHKDRDILKRFPVVYSFKLRDLLGREILTKQVIEAGFYQLEK